MATGLAIICKHGRRDMPDASRCGESAPEDFQDHLLVRPICVLHAASPVSCRQPVARMDRMSNRVTGQPGLELKPAWGSRAKEGLALRWRTFGVLRDEKFRVKQNFAPRNGDAGCH